jgi:hypothetical protein
MTPRAAAPIRSAALAVAALLALALPGLLQASDAEDPVLFVHGVDAGSGLATLLKTEATSALREFGEWFGTPVKGPVSIHWAATREDLLARVGRDPGPVAGVALSHRSEIVLFAPALASRPDRISRVLRHEACHLVFAAATAGAEVEAPRWLNEGMAMWKSGEWDLGMEWKDHASLVRDAAAAGSLFRLEQLDATFPTGPFFHVAYAQSLSFVEWMVRHGGENGVRRFVDRLDRDEDPLPAFEAVYGLTLSEAEDAWRDDVIGSGLGRLPSGQVLVNAMFWGLGLLMMGRFAWVRWKLRRAQDEEDEAPVDADVDPDRRGDAP